jgi:hypothetical protein
MSTSQQRRQVLDPHAELACGDSGGVVFWIIQDAKDTSSEELCDGTGHAGEPVQEKVDGISTVEIEGGTSSLSGVCPWIVVV